MLFIKPLKHNLGAATCDNPTYKYCNPIKSSFRRNPIRGVNLSLSICKIWISIPLKMHMLSHSLILSPWLKNLPLN